MEQGTGVERLGRRGGRRVSGFKFRVSGGPLVLLATVAMLAGCSPKQGAEPTETNQTVRSESTAVSQTDDHDLLMRVRFAGTTALMADTNAAYLTNIAALPETAALGRRIVERMAGLASGKPEILKSETLKSGGEHSTSNIQHSTFNIEPSTNALEPMFAELLRTGFVLELRGDSQGVNRMLLAGKASSETAARWQTALADAGGSNQMAVLTTNGWVTVSLSQQPGTLPSSVLRPPFSDLEAPNVLEVQMASTILPGPIRTSLYGNFNWFHFEMLASEQSLKVRGTATYDRDLPASKGALLVPMNVARGVLTSITAVRSPAFWLRTESPIRSFLPNPVPDQLFFWGTDEAPFAFHSAMPVPKSIHPSNYTQTLADQLQKLITSINAGNILTNSERSGFDWLGMPFAAPSFAEVQDGANAFWVADLAPRIESTNQIPQALLGRISDRPDLLIYDWEFTGHRLTGWLYTSQLALMLSNHKQLGQESVSTKWILAVSQAIPNGGNTVTEITQSNARKLELARRAPIALTSTEIIWLANWLESDNFPAANFLMPMPKEDLGTVPPQQ